MGRAEKYRTVEEKKEAQRARQAAYAQTAKCVYNDHECSAIDTT